MTVGQESPAAGGRSALVVGCGLIGTSIALALRAAGWTVWLADHDPDVSATAAALGAGTPIRWPAEPGAGPGDSRAPSAGGPVDIAVIAVPPLVVASAAQHIVENRLAATVMHVASVQTKPQRDIELLGMSSDLIVGTHPMAGSERGGPAAAAPGLFRDRPWVICAGPASDTAVTAAHRVVTACGGRPVVMTAGEHDAAVAVISHVPQLASSAVAGLLAGAAPAAVGIAGAGVRDVTRLAEGDPALWRQIITANAAAVAPVLRALRDALGDVVTALETDPAGDGGGPAVSRLVEAGRLGRSRLGGKHGGRQRHWASVQVVIPDRPGALVEVLSACRDQAVNLEDLRVEHSAGAPNGLLELLVEPDRAGALADALRGRWEILGVVRPHD